MFTSFISGFGNYYLLGGGLQLVFGNNDTDVKNLVFIGSK